MEMMLEVVRVSLDFEKHDVRWCGEMSSSAGHWKDRLALVYDFEESPVC